MPFQDLVEELPVGFVKLSKALTSDWNLQMLLKCSCIRTETSFHFLLLSKMLVLGMVSLSYWKAMGPAWRSLGESGAKFCRFLSFPPQKKNKKNTTNNNKNANKQTNLEIYSKYFFIYCFILAQSQPLLCYRYRVLK